MTNALAFDTITSAADWYHNSGYVDWEWFDGFDESELIEALYKNSDGERPILGIVKEFLIDHG